MKGFDKIFQGAIFTVGMRWTDRLIGFLSTIILARLLIPADFGVVAMASIIVGLFDVLLDLGVRQALVHNKDAEKADYDTAWTLRLIQTTCVGSLILVFAPLAAQYFGTSSIVDVSRVMALSLLIGGFENIGIVMFQKKMQFDREFKFRLSKRLLGFTVTIGLAFVLRSYWAMVFGTLVASIFGVFLSYIVHPLRPRVSLERFSTIWSFSQWMLVKNMGTYLNQKLAQLLVGRKLDADALGGYALATDITSLPSTGLLQPLGRVLFPAFVEIKDDPIAFSNRITTAIGVQCSLVLPACLGLMFVADDAVVVLLGDKWLFVIPLVQIMAFGNFIMAFAHTTHYVLLTAGKVRLLTFIVWFQAILFVVAAILFWQNATVETFAAIRLFVLFLGSLLMLQILLFHLRAISVTQFFSSIFRPLVASLIMLLALYFIDSALTFLSPITRLSCNVVTGGTVYLGIVFIMWLIAGKPQGAEMYFLENIMRKK